jgi:hypothetical protein
VSNPAITGLIAAEATMKVFIFLTRTRQQADLVLSEQSKTRQLEATVCIIAQHELLGLILHPWEIYIITIAGP